MKTSARVTTGFYVRKNNWQPCSTAQSLYLINTHTSHTQHLDRCMQAYIHTYVNLKVDDWRKNLFAYCLVSHYISVWFLIF